jgi:hypothetical protein
VSEELSYRPVGASGHGQEELVAIEISGNLNDSFSATPISMGFFDHVGELWILFEN